MSAGIRRGPIARGTELRALLRGAGLRATAARVAVIDCLRRARSPLSHGQVHERLAGSGLDRATVYRNLVDLAEAGLLSRRDLGDHVWRFELRGHAGPLPEDHPHFVCDDCGGVACMPGVKVRIADVRRRMRARVDQVLLRGRCAGCG